LEAALIKKIVVPLDGSEYSERALVTATEIAQESHALLTLITVISAYREAHLPIVPKLEEQARQRAASYLDPFVKATESKGFPVVAKVAEGAPADQIVRWAEECDADMIVMSTHGIGAAGRHALGSIAMKVLESAPCPVLMVRIPQSGQVAERKSANA
jgi:nucleotide-binding universal stress UspA family protein